MTIREETPETRMTREVKDLYLARMGDHPALSDEVFGEVFATVARKHGHMYHRGKAVLNDQERADRRVYILYFRLIQSRLEAAIKRLVENERRNQAARMTRHTTLGSTGQMRGVATPSKDREPVQLDLPLAIPPPLAFHAWREEFRAKHS